MLVSQALKIVGREGDFASAARRILPEGSSS
jgi:hypothetical protein